MIKAVDDLDKTSREFYERARFKLALSLILAAIVSLQFLSTLVVYVKQIKLIVFHYHYDDNPNLFLK